KMKIAFQGFVMLFPGARPDFDFKYEELYDITQDFHTFLPGAGGRRRAGKRSQPPLWPAGQVRIA
ncbi:MAG TPA: hypothetical protein VFV58_26210, partial [Blastocatellia bacterium]|nr:hypothetical protein [Blastocatellia bacterium]